MFKRCRRFFVNFSIIDLAVRELHLPRIEGVVGEFMEGFSRQNFWSFISNSFSSQIHHWIYVKLYKKFIQEVQKVLSKFQHHWVCCKGVTLARSRGGQICLFFPQSKQSDFQSQGLTLDQKNKKLIRFCNIAPFQINFSKIQCMLDQEVVCKCYDKWNKRGSTIKRDIK